MKKFCFALLFLVAGLSAQVDEAWNHLARLGDYEAARAKFEPAMAGAERERKYAGWKDAVRRTLT